jgi:peptide/nickel transport system substrate-binding protein
MLWNKHQAGTQQIWVQAFNASIDPDMYQSYYSTNAVGASGTQSNHFAITDEELDRYIMLGRQITNQTERKQIYKKAMDIVLDGRDSQTGDEQVKLFLRLLHDRRGQYMSI